LNDTPLVSIIIPVFNAEQYIADTINSALSQTWSNIEIIIVDDGSTDQSLNIARKFNDGRISVITQKNKGASAARNAGLKEAKGEYIQFLDADDLLSPDKIEAQVACLKGSATQLAICKTVHFKDGESYPDDCESTGWLCAGSNNPVDFLTKLYAGEEVMPGYGGMITVHSWLSPRNLIDKAGPWNESLSLDDDGEFFFRVVLASEGIKFSDKGLSYYRRFDHQQSLSAQKNRKAMESAVLATDLKIGYLKAKTNENIVNRVFAKHYWWTGVIAYPRFKSLSKYCIQKAKQLGYNGEKYVGGPGGHFLARFLGWKAARLVAYYRQTLKRA
jgi:glycosyltransferase involved in cell wall biosynthesis